LLSYPSIREKPVPGHYKDIWDGSAISTGDISENDVVFMTNFDPFNPFGMTSHYSCASFVHQVTNVPLGVRHLPFWHFPSMIVPGPRKRSNIRSYSLVIAAEARLLKKGNIE
jgi:hypothetical protein